MGKSPTPFNRTLTGTAAAVLLISLALMLIPNPPKTDAHVRTKAGTVTMKIVYAFARPVKYSLCKRFGDLYPTGYGCLQWVTKIRMENCPGPGPGCSVVNSYTRVECSGYWAGTACRDTVTHRHPTTTTTTRPPTTTTTTRPPTTTRSPTTTRPVTTTTRAVSLPSTTRATRPPTPRPRPTPTTRATRPRPTRPTRPVPPPTTRPRPSTTTTTRPPDPTHCRPLSDADLELVRDRFGWDTVLGRPEGLASGVAGGDEIPVGTGSARLFVTSNKLLESASAEPRIWPLVPEGVTVASQGAVGDTPTTVECSWDLQSVRSRWRELLVWRWADRTQLRNAAPDLVEQWERMGESRRRAVQARHRSSGVTNPTEVVCKVGQPGRRDCVFFVSHPSVWEWKLWATFRTADGDTSQERTLLVQSGVSRLQRLVDYTSSTARVCTGEDC